MKRDTSDPPKHHTHPRSSLSRRGTVNYDPFRITGASTHTPSRISIPFPLSQISQTASQELTYLRNWTSDGGTTMYESKRETNGRRPLKQNTGYGNQR